MTLKNDAKFEEKLTYVFEKWHEESGKFLPEDLRDQNLVNFVKSTFAIGSCTFSFAKFDFSMDIFIKGHQITKK